MEPEYDILRTWHQMLILDLYRLADALGIEAEGIGDDKGISVDRMIEKIEELKRHASHY